MSDQATTTETLLIRRLVRIATLTRILRQVSLAELDLEVGQDMLLDQLSLSKPRSVTAVAAALDIRPSTVSKMVARLEAEGFIMCERDQTDRRLTQLRLTDRGERLQARIRVVFGRIDADLAKQLPGGVSSPTLEGLERLDTALTRQVAKLR